jgi:ferrous iron transport protein A
MRLMTPPSIGITIDNCSHLHRSNKADLAMPGSSAQCPLSALATGARATVARVVASSLEVDAVALRRLGELGFLPGEPVRMLHRGPGGREPLAVLIGETMFALRLLEAQCIEVTPDAVA